MKKVGELLKEARRARNLTVDQVAAKIKIRSQFITAIEENKFEDLPSATVAQGFVKNYAEFLDSSAQYALALFRRDFVEDPTGKVVPRGLAEPLNKAPFWRSNWFGYFLLALGLLLAIGGYLFFQYYTFWQGPQIVVESPEDGQLVVEKFVEIKGCTEPEAVVRINEQLVSLDVEGCFRQGVSLIEGENEILLVAENKIGRAQTVVLRVRREK